MSWIAGFSEPVFFFYEKKGTELAIPCSGKPEGPRRSNYPFSNGLVDQKHLSASVEDQLTSSKSDYTQNSQKSTVKYFCECFLFATLLFGIAAKISIAFFETSRSKSIAKYKVSDLQVQNY